MAKIRYVQTLFLEGSKMSLKKKSGGEQFVHEDPRGKRLYLQQSLAVSSMQFFLIQQKDGARTYTLDKIRLSHPKQSARLIAEMGYAWQAESVSGRDERLSGLSLRVVDSSSEERTRRHGRWLSFMSLQESHRQKSGINIRS